MDQAQIAELQADLIRDEGYRQFVYQDTMGIPTIGIGRNLKAVGVSLDEAEYLLANDIARAWAALIKALPWIIGLDSVRQNVLCNMCFNMGIAGLLKFKRFLEAMRLVRFEDAAAEMLDSQWAKQVGARAHRLADMVLTGKYQDE